MSLISQIKKFSLVLIGILFFIIIMVTFIDFKNDVHINFSIESGYYDDVLELKIYGGAGNRICYTLDGSEPGIDDNIYNFNKPILLTDATYKNNIYSARTDTTTAFWKDLVDTYSMNNPGYTVPNYNVDKCNIVRASVFNEKGECLDTITGVYFIGFQNKSGYDGIYTASIVTDPSNLFDYENGIYTTGITFDRIIENIPKSKEENSGLDWWYPYWWWWASNYSNRGIAWEREANVMLFNEDKEMVLSENCGIRIQGGGSRGKLPKSIGCYARKLYGGSNEFQTDLFQMNQFPHKFVFFSGGDDNVFKLKDYLANTMERELHFATMDFIPCAVFLDGEYWGVYFITENYNADYISDHYHVKEDNVIMVKNGELVEGNTEDTDFFQHAMEYISANDMSITENYEQACNLIDMESYIDYYAAQIYIARNNDWPGGNYAAWRTRENDGSAYGDCRWRWMLFDVNSGGLSIGLVEADTLSDVLNRDSAFNSLYLNQEFRVKFARRLLYIGKEIFSIDKCQVFIDNYFQTMREPIIISNYRFYNEDKADRFDENVDNIRLFFQKRYDVIWNILASNTGEEWLKQNGIQK